MRAGIPSPSVSALELGPLTVHFYGLMIGIGVLVAYAILERRYRARGGPAEVTSGALIVMLICGVVGARLYHVLTLPEPFFGPNGDPMRVFYIWQGGLGIMGAVAGGALGAFVYLRAKGLRLAPFADAVAPALLVAQAIGRWGNWFNQELYGRATTLPWGLEIDERHLPAGYAPGTLFHPTFLYESLWNLLGAAVLIWLDRRHKLSHGVVFALYMVWYGIGRNVTESLRIDETILYFGLRVNQWFAVAVLVAGLALLAWTWRRHRRSQGELVWTDEARGSHPETAG